MGAPFIIKPITQGTSDIDACIIELGNHLAQSEDFSQIIPSIFKAVMDKYNQSSNSKMKLDIMVEYLAYAGRSLEVSREDSLQAKYLANLLGISETQAKACWNIAKQKVLDSYQSPNSQSEQAHNEERQPVKVVSNANTRMVLDQTWALIVASICGPIIWLITTRKDYIKFIFCASLYIIMFIIMQTENRTGLFIISSATLFTIIRLLSTLDIGLRSDDEFAHQSSRSNKIAVTIATFFSFYTWAYTCKHNKIRFLVAYSCQQLIVLYITMWSTLWVNEAYGIYENIQKHAPTYVDINIHLNDALNVQLLYNRMSIAFAVLFIYSIILCIWSVLDSRLRTPDVSDSKASS